MENKILIVEDNKTLANLIAKKISNDIDFEIDVAYSLKEAKLFLAKNNYFTTLLDINLPDAPDGEVVDYAIKKGQHVIVLSANIDKEFREKMLNKDIVDYVNKSGIDDINYIIQTIKRLHKNIQHRVVVVDNSIPSRKKMQILLENMYFKVFGVAHGEEVMGIIDKYNDISLIITNDKLPVMDGLELISEVRKRYSKNILSIIVLSSNDDGASTALFLKKGANDYIKNPFSKEEFSCRINNAVEAIENIKIISDYQVEFDDL